MKCPECNINLKRRRITREAKTVERLNFCPACNARYLTVEMFQGDYDKLIGDHEKKLQLFSDQYYQLKEKYDNLIKALGVVSQAVKEESPKD